MVDVLSCVHLSMPTLRAIGFGQLQPPRLMRRIARNRTSANPRMTPQDALSAKLKGFEEELLESGVRKSTRLADLLADDFSSSSEFGSHLHKEGPRRGPSGGNASGPDDVGLQRHFPGTGCRTLNLQDPSPFRAVGGDAAFVRLATDQRPVANGFPPGDIYPNGLAILRRRPIPAFAYRTRTGSRADMGIRLSVKRLGRDPRSNISLAMHAPDVDALDAHATSAADRVVQDVTNRQAFFEMLARHLAKPLLS